MNYSNTLCSVWKNSCEAWLDDSNVQVIHHHRQNLLNRVLARLDTIRAEGESARPLATGPHQKNVRIRIHVFIIYYILSE